MPPNRGRCPKFMISSRIREWYFPKSKKRRKDTVRVTRTMRPMTFNDESLFMTMHYCRCDALGNDNCCMLRFKCYIDELIMTISGYSSSSLN